MGFETMFSPGLISMFDAGPIKRLLKWVPKHYFFVMGRKWREYFSISCQHLCITLPGLWKPENVDQNEFRSCQNVKCLSAFTRISLPTCSFFLTRL